MKTLIFVVLDGGADLPDSRIGNMTAFDVAFKPNIDSLSKNGINGIMKVLPIPPESDEAVISILGYDVFKVYTGRGPLEAIGGGLPFKEGDLALRCNFGTLEEGQIVDVRSGGLTTQESKELEDAINSFVSLDGAKFSFKATTAYRGVLVIRSKERLSPKISNTHPGYALRYFEPMWTRGAENIGVPVSEALASPNMAFKPAIALDNTKEAKNSAKLVNEFIEKSRAVLYKHPVNMQRIANGLKPANIILTRDSGTTAPRLYSFSSVYDTKWLCMADMPVERGIAIASSMQVLPMPEPTENAEKDMTLRVLALLKNAHLYDAFYVHLKGPDIYAHKGDIEGKIKSIEDIDRYFFGPLLANFDMNNSIVVVTCDHTTSSEQRVHTADPVPVTISGAGITTDGTTMFSEATCATGALKQINALHLMPYLMKLIKS